MADDSSLSSLFETLAANKKQMEANREKYRLHSERYRLQCERFQLEISRTMEVLRQLVIEEEIELTNLEDPLHLSDEVQPEDESPVIDLPSTDLAVPVVEEVIAAGELEQVKVNHSSFIVKNASDKHNNENDAAIVGVFNFENVAVVPKEFHINTELEIGSATVSEDQLTGAIIETEKSKVDVLLDNVSFGDIDMPGKSLPSSEIVGIGYAKEVSSLLVANQRHIPRDYHLLNEMPQRNFLSWPSSADGNIRDIEEVDDYIVVNLGSSPVREQYPSVVFAHNNSHMVFKGVLTAPVNMSGLGVILLIEVSNWALPSNVTSHERPQVIDGYLEGSFDMEPFVAILVNVYATTNLSYPMSDLQSLAQASGNAVMEHKEALLFMDMVFTQALLFMDMEFKQGFSQFMVFDRGKVALHDAVWNLMLFSFSNLGVVLLLLLYNLSHFVDFVLVLLYFSFVILEDKDFKGRGNVMCLE